MEIGTACGNQHHSARRWGDRREVIAMLTAGRQVMFERLVSGLEKADIKSNSNITSVRPFVKWI
jgi:hypothetical protein